jgi:hypothetical protein
MGVKVTNNAYGTLSAGIAAGDTTITLDGGQGARFPTLGAGDYFYGTLIDTGNNIEVVKVTARSSDSMTVVRGQDNTTAGTYAIGDRFELRPTAALFESIIDEVEIPGITSNSTSGTAITIDSSNDVSVANKLGVGVATPAYNLDTGGSGTVTHHIKGNGAGYTNACILLEASDVGRGLGTYYYSGATGEGYEWYAGLPYGGGTLNNADKFQIMRQSSPTTKGQDTAAGSTYFKIDSAGRVTTPYQPAFHAVCTSYPSSSQTIVFNSVNLNQGGHYNNTNGRFTAPVAGVYHFTFSTLVYNMGSASSVYLYINGGNGYNMSSFGTYGQFSGSYAGQGAAASVYLNAGDYVTMYFSHAGTNLHGGYTWWSGHLVG